MIKAFERATNRILAHLGVDAVLRDADPCRVNIEHGVEVADGDAVFLRSVANIPTVYRPKPGDALRLVDSSGDPILGESYVLDGPAFRDNGCLKGFVIRKTGE